MIRLTLTILLLAATVAADAGTYFFDPTGGNDANNGLSKATAKKHHFYMKNYAGPAYSHQGGDVFVFKGGEVWNNACFQMKILLGGTSPITRDFYTADVTWFIGGSFTRPLFDLQNVYLGGWGSAASAVYMSGPNFVTFDNIEIANQVQDGNFGASVIYLYGSSGFTITNSVIRAYGQQLPIVSPNGNNGAAAGFFGGAFLADNVATHCTITQVGTPNGHSGNVLDHFQLVEYNEIYGCTTAWVGNGTVRYNYIHDMVDSEDSSTHQTGIKCFANASIYGNVIRDCPGRFAPIELESGQASNSGNTYVYDNVVWNTGQTPCWMKTDKPGWSGITVHIYNNTLVAPGGSGLCFYSHDQGTALGGLDIRNNHFITSATPIEITTSGPLTVANNTTMTPAQASAFGYTSGNFYAPTSSGSPTVGQGVDLSAFFTTGLDPVTRLPFNRSVPWDVGAYEYTTAGGSPGTVALSTSAVPVLESAGSVTLTVQRSSGTTGAIGVSYATANGTASSGVNYTATSGSFSWANGDNSSRTITVPILSVPFSGSKTFTITLSLATGGASIGSPSVATVTVTGVGGAPGSVTLGASSGGTLESVTPFTVTIKRTGGTTGAIGVTYTTTAGTATAGVNYTTASGTLSWVNGDAADKTVTIPILAVPFTGTKAFTFNLSAPTGGASLGAIPTETITITGVGSPGALQLSSATGAVNENVTPFTATVKRVGGSTGPVTISYATANGTATAGVNYTSASGTLSWANGDSSDKPITVTIINANFIGSKTFTITLSAPTGGATLGSPSVQTVTITGVGVSPGAIQLGGSAGSTLENVTPFPVIVKRISGNVGTVGISYSTANGTAAAGVNYTSTSGTLSWPALDTADKTINVPILNVPFIGSKAFTFNLSSPTGGASLVGPSTETITINGVGVPATNVLNGLCWEAETAALQTPMTTGTAGGKTYIFSPTDGPTPSSSGVAAFTFTNVTAGTYVVSATISTPSQTQNSFWVTMNTYPATDPDNSWDMPVTGAGVWQTNVLATWRGNGNNINPQFNPETFTVPAGTNTLYIVAREAGALIDKLCVQALGTPSTAGVVRVTAPASTWWRAGQTVPITINFTTNVVVTGTPTLALNTSATASYASGSGSSNLVFNYLVAGGQNTTALDYSATNSLALSGGTIKDAAANAANLTLPAPGGAGSMSFGNRWVGIDTIAPTVSIGTPSASTATNGTLVIQFPITYSDTGTNFFGNMLAPANVTLATTGTAQGVVSILTTGGLTAVVQLTSLLGTGTYQISLSSGTGDDYAGNVTAAAGPSAVVTMETATKAKVGNAVIGSGRL